MLYRPELLDFSRSVLIFVHIPKAAGSAVEAALEETLGVDGHLFLRLEKIGKVHPSRPHKIVWETRKFLRNAIARARGGDPLLPKGFTSAQLDRLAFLNGHVTLGAEPKTGRQPLYITVVRDPVDRFLSDYYYRFDMRAAWPSGKRERHPFWTYEIDRFVDYVYKRRAWTDTNLQCRYIGGQGEFGAAKDAIDNRVFLAAPSGRLGDFLELLRPVVPLRSTEAPRANVGKARQGKEPPTRESLEKIREMVAEDQQLFDYVSAAFDDLYRRYAAGAPGA